MPGADIRTAVLGRRKSEGWWPEALLMITLSLLVSGRKLKIIQSIH